MSNPAHQGTLQRKFYHLHVHPRAGRLGTCCTQVSTAACKVCSGGLSPTLGTLSSTATCISTAACKRSDKPL